MNVRTSVVLLSAIALAGCKVEIKVPEGGHVEGYTLHGCGEAQTCIIDVDHTKFWDILSAVPKDTHSFVGWKKSDGYLCGGTKDDCKLSTLDFIGENWEAVLADDDMTVYLEPVFKPKYAGYVNRINPNLSISVEISQVNYPVDGTSHDSWLRDSQSSSNPLSLSDDGSKPLGRANWSSDRGSYSYRYSNNMCSMTRYEKNFHQVTTLPSPQFSNGYESVEANEYYWDIVFHEGAHQRINRWYFDRRLNGVNELFYPRKVSGVDGLDDCKDYLYEELVRINEETGDLRKSEHDEFHSMDTGAYWGRCEDSNRFMNAYCPEGMR
jgi:hypothetical protein